MRRTFRVSARAIHPLGIEETLMTPHRTIMTTLVAAALAIGGGPAALAADIHAHATGTPAKLALDHGRKWATDEPLRRHMSSIRQLVEPRLAPIHAGTLAAADYRALGAAIEGEVAGIVAECKLAPDADAMLHLIVADLVAGADVMQGKAAGKPAAGAHTVVTAANAYGRYFDHAGWKPLR
jgi:hypothetical protein